MTRRDSIAASLRDDIAAGGWAPGDQLPTEGALAARFGVNRHTVRAALAVLAEDGLVHARRGAGTFVAAKPAAYPLGRRVRFHQNLAGRAPEKRMLSLETRAATERESAALTLTPGAQVHVLDGISLADGRPIALSQSCFPADGLEQLPDALRADPSVTAALKACGVSDHVRVESRIDARVADALQAGLLEVKGGAALARVTSINADGDGRRVEWGRTWFVGERVTLVVDHP